MFANDVAVLQELLDATPGALLRSAVSGLYCGTSTYERMVTVVRLPSGCATLALSSFIFGKV